MASYPNRCQHLKINGTQCGSPALRRNRFCFFHKRFHDDRVRLALDRKRRPVATFMLPVLEDANSIQVALQQVIRLLLSQQIDHKTASLLLYALQTASTNLRQANFSPPHHEVVLDPREAANTILGRDLWDDEDFEEETDEEEDEADLAIAALEDAKKKHHSEVKWRRWAERQAGVYPTFGNDPRKRDPDSPPDLKKAPADMKPEEIRAEVAAIVRQQLVPKIPEILAKHEALKLEALKKEESQKPKKEESQKKS